MTPGAAKPNGLSFGTPRDWAKDLAIATGIGVFLGVIGPFGSFNGGPLELRVFYWTANLWIGFIVLSLVVRLSLWGAGRLDLPIWFALPAGVAVGALPLGLLVAVFSAFAWPGTHGRIADFPVWYGETLAISLPCAFGYYFLTGYAARQAAVGSGPKPAAIAVAPPAASEARFLDRLNPRLGRDLLCLQMEDHYVRAHTRKGSDLVLISLREAMAELAEVEGLQVHRSWWVARAAVEGSMTDGRNLRLRLAGGLLAPVSRPFVARLKASGWLTS